MQQFINFLHRKIFLALVLVLIVPSFYGMMRFGMFSTQDFHIFRLVEFDKCVRLLQIPCRWSPDAGLGYGEPIFNYYGQFAYAVGEIFHLFGISFIDSVKTLFIVSLLGSGLTMFILVRRIWKNNLGALVSSILYVYAPYRAVDVWVRGALPEAFSFILFPLIILSIEENSLGWFSVLVSILVLTHNLSFVMFLPIVFIWLIYRKFWKGFAGLLIAAFMSAFYILPIIFESKFVGLQNTITGYFDYRAHFVTLYQLLISRFWGYGASVWGASDGLSLSLGQIQWIVPLLTMLVIFFKRKVFASREFIILFAVGLFYIFLTHNKSTIIWNLVSPMSYIQFPWRFLGLATFCFALASGLLVNLFGKKNQIWISVLIILVTIFLNISFFRPDIWYAVGDSYYLTGEEWTRQRTASIGDFWPNFGHEIPSFPSDGKFINYFPGWVGATPVDGLISTSGVRFTDTPVRRIGNTISLISFVAFAVFCLRRWKEKI